MSRCEPTQRTGNMSFPFIVCQFRSAVNYQILSVSISVIYFNLLFKLTPSGCTETLLAEKLELGHI